MRTFQVWGWGNCALTAAKSTRSRAGCMELELSHPMDEDGRYNLLMNGRVLKVPAPAKTTPHIAMEVPQQPRSVENKRGSEDIQQANHQHGQSGDGAQPDRL